MNNEIVSKAKALNELTIELLLKIERTNTSDGRLVPWEEFVFNGNDLRGLARQFIAVASGIQKLQPGVIRPSEGMLADFLYALTEAYNSIADFHNQITYALTSFTSFLAAQPSHGTLISQDGNQINVQSALHQWDKYLDLLLRQYAAISSLADNKARGARNADLGLNHFLRDLAKLLDDQKRALVDIEESKAKSLLIVNDIEGIKENFLLKNDGIKKISENTNLALTLIQNAEKAAEKILQQSAPLDKQIDDVSSRLSSFQAEYNRHMKEASKALANVEGFKQRASATETEVSRLIADAELMLKGATVAGLAKSFGDQSEKLAKSVSSAQYMIYFFAFATLLATLPLAWPVIGPLSVAVTNVLRATDAVPIPPVVLPEIKDGLGLAAYLVARGGLVLPFAVLLAFTLARHNALFRLQQHYAFKHSIAMSVEGFKKQAPKYENEIAAMSLDIIAFNPAERLRGQFDRENRVGRMFRAIRERLLAKLEKLPEVDKNS